MRNFEFSRQIQHRCNFYLNIKISPTYALNPSLGMVGRGQKGLVGYCYRQYNPQIINYFLNLTDVVTKMKSSFGGLVTTSLEASCKMLHPLPH
jgi:hypothetical protein